MSALGLGVVKEAFLWDTIEETYDVYIRVMSIENNLSWRVLKGLIIKERSVNVMDTLIVKFELND